MVSFARGTYANDFGEGTKVLRPYHLSWRADFGLSSMIEPDVLVMLAEVILAEGQGVSVSARYLTLSAMSNRIVFAGV